MKTIEMEDIKVKVDYNKLCEDINNMEYCEEGYSGDGGNFFSEKFDFRKIDFDDAKIILLEELIAFKNSDQDLIQAINSKVKLNKNGKINGRGRYFLRYFGCPSDYSNYYGSHKYTETGIEAVKTGDYELTLELVSRSVQESF